MAAKDISQPDILAADYIAHCLVECGVTHVFGGHGGAVVPLIDAICRHPKLTWVLTRIEVSASMAAAAYAKVSGTLGCCVGTSGPGASHLTTGLIEAEQDRVPVLCFTGLKKREGIGYSDFQDINQTELFDAAGISFSRNVIHRNGLVPLLRDAMNTALTLDVCAHLAIPVDVQQAMITAPHKLSKDEDFGDLSERCSPEKHDIKEVVDFLVKSRENKDLVLFAIGQRAAIAGKAASHILEIADILGTPIVTTLDAKGSVREDHPQVLGVFGIFGKPGMEASAHIVTTATGIVSFGVDDHAHLLAHREDGHQTAQLVQINQAGRHDLKFESTILLAGDMEFIAKAILTEISRTRTKSGCQSIAVLECSPHSIDDDDNDDQVTQPSTLTREITWGSIATLKKFDAKANHARPSSYQSPKSEITTGFCHPGMVMQRLGEILKKGAIVCIDTGEASLWASLCLCLKRDGQRAITSLKLGTKGCSVYGAMGSVAFKPNAQIVGISDDRCFQFAINELATLRQMRATVVFIILVRGSSHGCHNSQGQILPGSQIHNPDFCKVAKANGGQGIRLEQSDPYVIDEVLEQAFSNTGITLVEVVRDPAVKPTMRPHRDTEISGLSHLKVEEV